jgi:Papain family cysteine protease
MKHRNAWLIVCVATAAVASAQEQPLPKKVDLTPKFKELGLAVRTQFGRPSCGTFAITALAEFESARGQPRPAPALSEEFLWWACDQAAGLKKDHSVLFQRVVNGLNTFGICTEELMPYAKKKDSPHKPSAKALKDAARRAERWQVVWIRHWAVNRKVDPKEFHALKQALAHGHPVACGLRWPKSSKGDDRLLQVPPANKVEDGHSVAFVGYEDDASKPGGGIFRIRNSWGPQWGNGGYGMMSYAYVRTYLNDALWLQWGPPHSEVPRERFQANALPVRARNRCDVSMQAMKPWGNGMRSHGKQLFCRAEPKGFVELEFNVKKAGRYRLRVEGTVAPDYGIISIALDGKPTGRKFDLYSGMVGPSGPLELGVHDLAATKHTIRFTAVGKNAVSENFWFGVSAIDLLAAKQEL